MIPGKYGKSLSAAATRSASLLAAQTVFGRFIFPEIELSMPVKWSGRFTLETVSSAGGAALQLTYSPGNALPTDVLRDGRILFEAAFPLGKGPSPEIYTVYSDGSGVEAYRCDHGRGEKAANRLRRETWSSPLSMV